MSGWALSPSFNSMTPSNSMTNLIFHDFLVEHAKFPFPEPSTGDTAASNDISDADVGLLDDQWRAIHAVCDDDLAKRLCDTLRTTLGNMALAEDSKRFSTTAVPKYICGRGWPNGPNVVK
jgi:hypothetical protein